MKRDTPSRPVERLFPFVLRARLLFVGRQTLHHSKSRLHFVLITRDLSESSREEMLVEFKDYPIVQQYTSDDLHRFFGINGAKVVGFKKSSLAQSIYAELKGFRINQPVKREAGKPVDENREDAQREGGREDVRRNPSNGKR